MPELAEIVDGEWPKPDPTGSGPIDVAVYEQTADDSFLNVGDIFQAASQQVRIVGIWRAIDQNNPDWFELPSTGYANAMWVPEATFDTRLSAIVERPILYSSWYVSYSERNLLFTNAPRYARGMVQMNNELSQLLAGMTTDYSPQEALVAYQQKADALTTLYFAVGAPMVVLALLFISLTATIAVQQYEQETATMRGRGTSWGQVVGLNLIESGLLIVLALLPSLLVGWLAAGMIQKTLSFLQFTNREGIPFTFQGVNFLWILLSAAVDYDTYLRQVKAACQAGASGVAVGRAVWRETTELPVGERQHFLDHTAFDRMRRITALVDALAKPWIE
ncbi:MAG: FtsX-like permease family protein, partial [Syntrophobacteraceae bacterium]|nr:FtsX-like permease family protein [Syntrophobacteraceae bacterium]